MSNQHTPANMYTIHETGQMNNNGTRRASQTDILIDTSSIPMSPNQNSNMLGHQHQLEPLQAQLLNEAHQLQPVTSQPGAGARVAPETLPLVYSVHPVFGLLDQHQALVVRQRAEPAATCCGFESANSYTVRGHTGAPLLKAVENSNCCERCCFESNREFNLSLVHGDETVARIRKPYRVSRLCCYANAVHIESPEDNLIGQIKQVFSLFGHPRYAIFDNQRNAKKPTFLIEATSCRYCCTPLLCTCLCGIRHFRILALDGQQREQVGSISRRWLQEDDGPAPPPHQPLDGQPSAGGQLESVAVEQDPGEPFGSQADDQQFGVQFSANLEARHKVLLLSACFMLDFFYFEHDRRRKKLASC